MAPYSLSINGGKGARLGRCEENFIFAGIIQYVFIFLTVCQAMSLVPSDHISAHSGEQLIFLGKVYISEEYLAASYRLLS